jgi:hypothetical protein
VRFSTSDFYHQSTPFRPLFINKILSKKSVLNSLCYSNLKLNLRYGPRGEPNFLADTGDLPQGWHRPGVEMFINIQFLVSKSLLRIWQAFKKIFVVVVCNGNWFGAMAHRT